MSSFGLNREYYHKVLKDIDYIARNSNGGYSFAEVYQFPIWLRRLILQEISDEIRERNNKIKESKGEAHEWNSKDLKRLKKKMEESKDVPYITKFKKK